MRDIYKFSDYKDYLRQWIDTQAGGGRGMQRKIAAAIGVQNPYISAVLNGNAHLSPEQAEAFNIFADHSELESHFFHLLVQHARAGTKALSLYYKKQLDGARAHSLDMSQRIAKKVTLPSEMIRTYFSMWYFAAIHILLTIPQFRTVDDLNKITRLPKKKLLSILEILQSAGLVTKKTNQYFPESIHMHLDNNSDSILQHHTNWRLESLKNIQNSYSAEDLHYSSVITISERDFAELKRRLVNEVQEMQKIINPSPAEKMFCFNIDLFEMFKK